MTSPFNRINRLRNQGMTWDTLGREIAQALNSKKTVVARNTLRSLQNLPHYNPGKELVTAINKVHDYHNPSPFSEGTNALMVVCRNMMRGNYNLSVMESLASLELHLNEQLTQVNQPDLIASRLYWALGNIKQFKMRLARLNKVSFEDIQSKQSQAIQCYQAAIDYIDSAIMPLERYKLTHNIFVCYVNAVREEERNNNTALAAQLRSIAYPNAAKGVLSKEPFQWETARNGLLYGSIIKDRHVVAYFFEALIMANKYFTELNYRPLDCDALIIDPSLQWALNTVLTPDLVETIIDVVERKKPLSKRN